MKKPRVPGPRHRLNAPGDFYVEDGMCILCRAPEAAAPNLIGFHTGPGGSHAHSSCYFRWQPVNAQETEDAIRAMNSQCCGALRYSGTDPAILKRLGAKRDTREQCDFPV